LARWTNYLARIIKQRRSAIPIYGNPNHLSGKNERCLTLAMSSQKLPHALRAINQHELADVIVLIVLLATAEDIADARKSIISILDAP
jgi:hypothetical protein